MSDFTKKRARQHTRRRLDTIEKSLIQASRHWGDLDNGVIYEIDELLSQISHFRQYLDDVVEAEAFDQ